METTPVSSDPCTPPNGLKRCRRNSDEIAEDTENANKKFRCEPCNQYFTRRGTLLRHQRENRKHHQQDSPYREAHVCDTCLETFAREHDLKRHCNEQHLDRKIACPGCGKRIRPKTRHNNGAGAPCHGGSSDIQRNATPASGLMNADLSRPQALCKITRSRVMDSLSQEMSNTTIGGASVDMATYKMQVWTKTADRLHPCGMCRMEFEINDVNALSAHLKEHFEALDGKYNCDICEVSFVHKADHTMHELSALKGTCGFKFVHQRPCTGHHRPQQTESGHERENSAGDRAKFVYQLRNWEQSQLTAFLSSLEPLAVMQRGRPQVVGMLSGNSSVVPKLAPNRFERFEYTRGTKTVAPLRNRWVSTRLVDASVSPKAHRNEDVQDLPISQCTEFLDRWLRESAARGDVDLTTFAIACGADVNGQDAVGRTALHAAAGCGSLDVAVILLEGGVRVNDVDHNRDTAFDIAVQAGHAKMLDLLFENGAWYERNRVDKSAALTSAIANQNFDIASTLVQRGAPVSKLHLGSAINQRADVQFFRVLLDNVEDLELTIHEQFKHNKADHTILCKTASSGDFECTQLLVRKGVDVRAKCKDGHTALARASETHRADIVQYLLAEGSDPNVQDQHGHTPLCQAFRWYWHQYSVDAQQNLEKRMEDTVRELLEANADRDGCKSCATSLNRALLSMLKRGLLLHSNALQV